LLLLLPWLLLQFAASTGGQFPAPQHSKGLSLLVSPQSPPGSAAPDAAAIKGTGVLLLGDAAHCFPPDLGEQPLLACRI
jgi:2-polyprenyl-6-methoxyphenol hydroxylase-like FAD-dependent oxidoreductase